jgi:isoamylase
MNTKTTFTYTTGSPQPFGATQKGDDVNFAIHAKEAHQISLCLFKEGSIYPIQEIELTSEKHQTGSIWHILLKDCPKDLLYAFRITLSDNTSYTLLDPYAKAISSHPTWGKTPEPHYLPLGKIISDSTFDWEDDIRPSIKLKDLIIYEMHVRGFTRDPSSGVKHPGTYLGLVEKLPYLKQLGINAIELMPLCEFNECENIFINPKTKKHLYNYFGYSPINYFSIMNRYASDSRGIQPMNEFKTLVKESHRLGIEVIVDVVYNHTGEGGENGPKISFKGFDKEAYYFFDNNGNYLNYSGCGNTINSNHPITIELILQSLRYWVTEMHVDGFRFDLASIMTRDQNGAPMDKAPLVEAISNDPILANTKLIAEAWDAAGLYQVGSFASGSPRWAEWNGKYRDIVRRFIKGTPGHKKAFASSICGSQDLYGNGKAPYCSVNFVTAHDGFSLQDLVSYNDKHNLENGESNQDGFSYNDSWNCGAEGPSKNQKVLELRERQKRNFMLALMISQGVPMLLMGDEYCHTRKGNNNTWSQDNELNWFLWSELEKHSPFYAYFHFLIQFRNTHPLLKQDNFLTDKNISWHGTAPFKPDWENDNNYIAFTLNSSEGAELYIAFNASHHPLTITLPGLPEGQKWRWIINTHSSSPKNFYEESERPTIMEETFQLRSYSAVIIEKTGEGNSEKKETT